jgi:hypothetical protein
MAFAGSSLERTVLSTSDLSAIRAAEEALAEAFESPDLVAVRRSPRSQR